MVDRITDVVFGGGKPGYAAEYTVDPGLYDWVIDFRRFNKNSGLIGYFVDDGATWIRLFDTRYDFPGQENFQVASFTIGNKFTFNGVDYEGEPFDFDHPEDRLAFFVVPTLTPQPGTFFNWNYDFSIVPANSGPRAENDVIQYEYGQKGAKTFDILANDHDPEGQLNRDSVNITRQPKWGTLSIENGVVTYTPNQPGGEPVDQRVPRTDTFTYTVKDANGELSNPATVRVKIGDCPEPLPMIVTGGDLEHRDGDDFCVIDGTFFIGRDDGEANLLQIRRGSAAVYDDKIVLHGDVYSGAFGRTLVPNATITLRAPEAVAKGGDFHAGSSISLAGLRFDPTNLKLEPNAVELGGKLKLSDAFDGINLDLDALGAPLRIVSGSLAAGSIEPPPITFTSFARSWQTVVEKFSLTYQPETDALRLNGLFSIEKEFFQTPGGKGFMRGVKLDLLTSGRYLEIKEGELAGNASFEIASNLQLGPTVTLSKITGSMKFEHDAIREISLGAKLKLPVFSISGELGVVNVDPPGSDATTDNLKLDKIKLGIEAGDKGVPIALGPLPPGIIYAVAASVEVDGLASIFFEDTPAPDAQLGLGGSMTFAFVADKKVKMNLADNAFTEYLGNLIGITSIDGYALSLEVGKPSAPPGSPANQSLLALPIGVDAHTEINGAFKLQSLSDRIFVVDGQGHWDFTDNKGHIYGHASLLNGLAEGSMMVTLEPGGLTMKGTLSGSVPIDGSKLSDGATVGLYGQFRYDDDTSNDYIIALTKVNIGTLTLRGGVQININPDYDGDRITFVDEGRTKALVGSWDVEAGEAGLVMQMAWTQSQDGAAVPIKVTYRPVGGELVEIFEEDFAANGITVVDQFSGDLIKTVVVENPAEGRWDIVALDESVLGEITYSGYSTDAEATFDITSTGVGFDIYVIDYELQDDGESTITWYWDTDDDGVGGTRIAVEEGVAAGAHTYFFNTPPGVLGTFYVYAEIDDGFYAPVTSEVVEFNSSLLRTGPDLNVESDIGETVDPGFVYWRVRVRNDGDAEATNVVLLEDIGTGDLTMNYATVGVTVEQVYEPAFDDDPDDDYEPEGELDPSRLRIVFDNALQPGEEAYVDFYTNTRVTADGRTEPGEGHLGLQHSVYADADANPTDNVKFESAQLDDPVPEPYVPGGPNAPDISLSHVDAGMHGNDRWINLVITNNGPGTATGVEVIERLTIPESGAQPGYLVPLPHGGGFSVDGLYTIDTDGDPLTRLVKLTRPMLPGETIVVPFRVGDAHDATATLEAKLRTPLNDYDPTNDVSVFTANDIVATPFIGYYAFQSAGTYRIEQGPPPQPFLGNGHLEVGTTYYSNFVNYGTLNSIPTIGGVVNVKLDGPATINFNGVNYTDDFTFDLSYVPGGLGVNVPGDTMTRLFSLTPTGEGDITLDLWVSGMSEPNTFDVAPNHSWFSAGDDPAPVFVGSVPTQTITQDVPFSLQLADALWAHPDLSPVDVTILDWFVRGKDVPPGEYAGPEWPSWLRYDALTQTFYGTMTATDVLEWPNYDLVIRVSNQHGGIVETVIDLDIVNPNEAPFVDNAYIDRVGFVGVELNLNLPGNVPRIEHDNFNGDERTPVTYFGDTDGWGILGGQRVVEVIDVNYTAWPDFLNLEFMQDHGWVLKGLPGAEDVGTHTITVTATDRFGGTASQTFELVIKPVNAPVPDAPMPAAEATQDEVFTYVIPANAFSDPDGEPVSYGVLNMPAWLRYDPETRTLSGTPGPGDVGDVMLEILASDGGLGVGRVNLTLSVADAEDAPLATSDFIGNVVAGTPYVGTTGALTDNDIEFDGDELVATLVTAPRFGTATVAADGAFTYTVGANFKGEDSFAYSVTDGTESSTARVYLGIGGEPDGAHTLVGAATADTLSGGYGDDTLDGRAGDDSLYGGAGNDTVVFGGDTDGVTLDMTAGTASGLGIGSDIVAEVEHAIGGTGNDVLLGSSARNILRGGDGADTIDGRDDRDTIYGGTNNDVITGGADHDTLWGEAGDDTIYGGAGNETIYGGAGNDTIYAGAGNDQYTGGDGDDVYYGVERFSVGGNIVDNLYEDNGVNSGRDTVYTGESDVTLASYIEVGRIGFSGAGNISGNFTDNVLYGNAAANTINGEFGNDTIYGAGGDDRLLGSYSDDFLYGGAGNDTMIGGYGNDLYRFDDVGDVASEAGTDGFDRALVYAVSATIAAGIERVDVRLATGSTITAAGATDNSLFGAAGNDRLNGGDGNDRMLGNEGDDILDGGAGNDVLYGGAGIDTMFGGAGDDLYRLEEVGDVVDETSGSGSDWVVAYVSGVTIGEGVERIDVKLESGATITAAGTTDNSLFGDIGNDHLVAGDGDDRLLGNGGNDVLYGGAGNDVLYGGAGIDTMFGGAGDDVYRIDEAGDVADETGGSGFDWAVVYVSGLTMGEGIERADLKLDTGGTLSAAGATDNTLTGGAGNDVLYGGAGLDRVLGGAGNDVLYGGLGNDGLRGDAGADVFFYAAGDGNDLILDFSAEDSVMLSGVSYVGHGATAYEALLSDGAIISAQIGWSWSAGDFV